MEPYHHCRPAALIHHQHLQDSVILSKIEKLFKWFQIIYLQRTKVASNKKLFKTSLKQYFCILIIPDFYLV